MNRLFKKMAILGSFAVCIGIAVAEYDGGWTDGEPTGTKALRTYVNTQDSNMSNNLSRIILSAGDYAPTSIVWLTILQEQMILTNAWYDTESATMVGWDIVTRYRTNNQDNYITIVTGLQASVLHTNWTGSRTIAANTWIGANPTNRGGTNWTFVFDLRKP